MEQFSRQRSKWTNISRTAAIAWSQFSMPPKHHIERGSSILKWLCKEATALEAVGLATSVPKRHPVMEKVLLNPETVIMSLASSPKEAGGNVQLHRKVILIDFIGHKRRSCLHASSKISSISVLL